MQHERYMAVGACLLQPPARRILAARTPEGEIQTDPYARGASGRFYQRGKVGCAREIGVVKMRQWLSTIVLFLVFPVVLMCSHRLSVAQTVPGRAPEARDMALVGFHDLQGRSAYQPSIQPAAARVIAHIRH